MIQDGCHCDCWCPCTLQCWAISWLSRKLFAQLFVQTNIKENIKVLHHWPLWGESTSAGKAENVSSWWCHHAFGYWWISIFSRLRWYYSRFPMRCGDMICCFDGWQFEATLYRHMIYGFLCKYIKSRRYQEIINLSVLYLNLSRFRIS